MYLSMREIVVGTLNFSYNKNATVVNNTIEMDSKGKDSDGKCITNVDEGLIACSSNFYLNFL